jgi:hypothetical protein
MIGSEGELEILIRQQLFFGSLKNSELRFWDDLPSSPRIEILVLKEWTGLARRSTVSSSVRI